MTRAAMSDNAESVGRLYAARAAGNFDDVVLLFEDDIVRDAFLLEDGRCLGARIVVGSPGGEPYPHADRHRAGNLAER